MFWVLSFYMHSRSFTTAWWWPIGYLTSKLVAGLETFAKEWVVHDWKHCYTFACYTNGDASFRAAELFVLIRNQGKVLSELFWTTLIKIPVIWHVMSCQLLNSYWSFHDCCTLMMEAVHPFETSVTIYRRYGVTSQNACKVITSQWKLQISQN